MTTPLTKIWIEDGIISILHRGPTTRAELEEGRRDASRLQAAHGINLILVDTRDAEMRITLVDLFDFTSTHATHFMPGTRLAVVLPAEVFDLRPSNLAVVMNVASNVGTALRHFSDEREAEAWLNS